MPAPKGNQFWRARATHGRNKIFNTPDDLWSACCEYFDWVEDNPLTEEQASPFKGEVTRYDVNKNRPMTISGLCLFLDIDDETWSNYKKREDFFGIIKKAEKIIYNQKFAGAAAGFFNSNIIARDLGLVDAQKVENTHKVVDDGKNEW